jgi:ABC-type branched-subunit amino acid transport system substrate-binding protein
MRQAEDLILRDYILSAASEINAAGGFNGRIVAVVKSDLIDLELQAA